MSTELQDKIARLPKSPGVYLMIGDGDEILYVGKAKELRQRVRNYFTRSGDNRLFIQFMRRVLRDVRCIVTHNEKEAMLLENTLIKKHKPRYNIQLRDDKQFLNVRIDRKKAFPRIELVRRVRKDDATYLGPFHSAGGLRHTLRFIQGIVPLRDCKDSIFNNRSRPCLKYEIGRCCAPCVDYVSEAEYSEMIDTAVKVIKGEREEVIARLEAEMKAEAGKLNFERAARLRDQLGALRKTRERQDVESHRRVDRDVVGWHREAGFLEIKLLFVRDGKLVNSQGYSFESGLPDEELLTQFLMRYYTSGAYLPDEILLPSELDDRPLLEEILRDERGAALSVAVPQRGEKRRLVEMAHVNAQESFRFRMKDGERKTNLLIAIQQRLQLQRFPEVIECYDISNLQGQLSVGSRVVFRHGQPDKKSYRKYKIRSIEGIDDYGSIQEVLRRRLADDEVRPDLMLIDGGLGHVNAAAEVFADLGIDDVDLRSIAKARARRDTEERFFTPSRSTPERFPEGAAELHLLQRLRDEAHRFAITYHRQLRSKALTASALDQVPGIGPARRRALLDQFGSVDGIRQREIEELTSVPGITTALARAILEALTNDESSA